MSFSTIVAEDQRLAILQLLEQDADYSHNEYVIGRLLATLGHAIGGDLLRSHLHWLAEQGLVKLDESADMLVAKLTDRGEDVALGRARVPGVARRRPGA